MNAPTHIEITANDDQQLSASCCVKCGVIACPPRLAHCDKPTSRQYISPLGTVEACTLIRIAPKAFKTPYQVGYVRLDAGPRIVCKFATDRSYGEAIGSRVKICPNTNDGKNQILIGRWLN